MPSCRERDLGRSGEAMGRIASAVLKQRVNMT